MHTTLTSKGQMTLPATVRNQLGLEAGDQLSVTVLDAETIVLKRRASWPIGALRDFLPKPPKALTVQDRASGTR